MLFKGTIIGEPTVYKSRNFQFNSTPNKLYAVSSFSPLTFTGAEIITSAYSTDAGTVTYYSRLYIIRSTSSAVSVVLGASVVGAVVCSIN